MLFKVHVNDGTAPVPEDDICYIVAKEGIFLKKKMGIMESIAPVKNISILDSVSTMAKMHIKKIPGGQFAPVVSFFKEVYKQYRGESIVLLFYDEVKRVYKIVPPHQKVTAAACDYNKGITIEGMAMIGTIHSHASMSAFHSGTDDKDEEHFDGLHITIGNVNDDEVSITASIVANGHRFVVQPEEYVDKLLLTRDVDEVQKSPGIKSYRFIDGKVQLVEGSGYSYRRFDRRYVVNVSEKYHKIPEGWMSMVERGTYTPKFNKVYGYGALDELYDQWYGGAGWGQHYDPSLWGHASRQVGNPRMAPHRGFPAPGNSASPLNVGPASSVKPVEFPKHDDLSDIVLNPEDFPCKTCRHRGNKFILEMNEDEEDPDIYVCKKCNEIIVDSIDSSTVPVCPVCNSDEFLVQLDEEELPDNYQQDMKEIAKSSVVVPINDTVIKSEFTQCPRCRNGFHKFAGETKCPFCYFELEEYDKEMELIEHQKADAGDYLAPDAQEINEIAMKEAIAQEKLIERIPDPNEPSVPIPERVEKLSAADESQTILRRMFKSVFGKKE